MKLRTQESVAEIEVSYKPAIGRKPKITTALDAYNELIPFFPTETIALQERFVAMYLNRANKVLGVYPISLGGMTGTIADVRLILSVALKIAATKIILAHNHPSGNLTASSSDKALTAKIKEACQLLDVCLMDHVILSSEGGYYSFADESLI
jgi:DNA repair protein RadC